MVSLVSSRPSGINRILCFVSKHDALLLDLGRFCRWFEGDCPKSMAAAPPEFHREYLPLECECWGINDLNKIKQ